MKPEIHEGILSLFSKWFTAMETANVDLALSLVTDDVIQVSPSGDRRVGRAQLREAFADFHGAYAERVQWSIENIEMSEQQAEVHIKETAAIRPRDGSASFRVTGYHVARVILSSSGAWLLAEDTGQLEGEPVTIPHEFELGGG